jgi:hypothetical protein
VQLSPIRRLALPLAGFISLAILASSLVVFAEHDEDHFQPGNLVVSRSAYAGVPGTVTPGETLPPGCVAGTVNIPLLPPAPPPPNNTTPVKVKCATAVANGSYPTVFNNNTADGSFGVTSPIFLDQMTPDGTFINAFAVDSTQIVTSFSSKSELALNLSDDRKSITFVGYRGGSGFVTSPNQLDVSNSNTPGVVDLSNPVISQYYRAVAEVDDDGNLKITEGNAYSGNNGRAAIKAHGLYYLTGNNNNGGLSTAQLTTTTTGVNLITSTGAQLLVPGAPAPVPPNIDMIGKFDVSQVGFPSDKPGKDNNYRGLTIHKNTLYVTKGSGGNGINTVYQVGQTGDLPDLSDAPLLKVPITILPGLWNTLAANTTPPLPRFPFGIWFADSKTLYVADEGDGTVANAGTDTMSGLEKWVFDGTQWNLVYTLQKGLNLGVPYAVPTPPGATPYPNPSPDGLRNLTGRRNGDGTVTIWAITSTVSASGDQGADPNQLVMITDRLNAKTLPALESFKVLRTAKYGEVLRGVSFTPGTEPRCGDDDKKCDEDHDHQGEDHDHQGEDQGGDR